MHGQRPEQNGEVGLVRLWPLTQSKNSDLGGTIADHRAHQVERVMADNNDALPGGVADSVVQGRAVGKWNGWWRDGLRSDKRGIFSRSHDLCGAQFSRTHLKLLPNTRREECKEDDHEEHLGLQDEASLEKIGFDA